MTADVNRRDVSFNANENTPLLAEREIGELSSTVPATSLLGKVANLSNSEASSSGTTLHDGTDGGSITTESDPDKPLPLKQILLLSLTRTIEPIVFFSIFPYINQMVAHNAHLRPQDVGFYSGLIESLFSLTQMIVMIFWGRASNRYGRKPVLVLSQFGIAIASTLFGFATELWQMFFFRCLAGVFAGSVVTVRTMISEQSTKKTQARAFSFYATAGNVGIMVGPLLGGALADPVAQYPGIFGHSEFLKHYPYALATILPGVIALASAILAATSIEETLPTRLKTSQLSADQTETGLGAAKNQQQEEMGMLQLLRVEGVRPVLWLYGHVMVLAFTFTAIIPVFWYEPVDLGGYGFSSVQISLLLALVGLSQVIWLLIVFPPLQKRIGTGGIMRWCAYLYPLFFILDGPTTSLLLRNHRKWSTITFWIVTPIFQALGSGVSMSFTAIQLALNDVSPNPQALATLNAIALSLVSGVRAFSPAAATAVFAIGVGRQIAYGYLAWIILVIIAVAFQVAMRWFPKKAEGKPAEE